MGRETKKFGPGVGKPSVLRRKAARLEGCKVGGVQGRKGVRGTLVRRKQRSRTFTGVRLDPDASFTRVPAALRTFISFEPDGGEMFKL